MSKLTREPCATCGTDTLHKVGLCLTCRTVAPRQSDFYGKLQAKRRRQFARLQAHFGKDFCHIASSVSVSKNLNGSELFKARIENSKRTTRRFSGETIGKAGVFGRGRERTKA